MSLGESKVQSLNIDVKSLDKSPTAFYVADAQGRVVYFNASMEALFEYGPEDYDGKVISMLAEDPEAAFDYINKSLTEGHGNWQGEITAKSKSGRLFPCQISATRFSIQKDNSTLTLGTARDMSDYRSALSDLKSRSDRLSTLASIAARIGIYGDPKRLTAEALQAISELVQIDKGLILLVDYSSGLLKLYSSYNINEDVLLKFERDTSWEKCLEGLVLYEKVPLLIKDASKEPLVNSFMKGAGTLAVIPIMSHDVAVGVMTISSGLPDNLDPADMEFLVALVSQVGIYIENVTLFRELNERKKQLELQNTDLEELLSIISHDLRSPLATIGGYASLLMKKEAEITPEERLQFSETIFRKTQETSQRFDDLLAFFRISLQMDEIKPEPVHVADIIMESMEEASTQEIRDQFTIQMPDNLPVLSGYHAHLIHIFTNLFSNAFKFTIGRENPVVIIDYEKTAEGDQQTHRFSITDNGPGIPAEYLKNIFKPFTRVPMTDDIPGTGIGLAAVERILRNHGSEVSVESREGKGSTFSFTLPWPEVDTGPE